MLLLLCACSKLKPNDTPPEPGIPDSSEGAGAGGLGGSTPSPEARGGDGGGDDDGGAGGDGGADACHDSCAEEGRIECATPTAVTLCARRGRCLSWIEPVACSGDAICCDGACVEIDDSNCGACGARCAGVASRCDRELRRCFCDEQACTDGGGHCEDESDVCAPRELYVDAAAEESGDGSRARPLRTISAALEIAVKLESASIRVAAGRYDAELGERFPLRIPGGVSLEGAGEGSTTIEGTGFYPQDLNGGAHRFPARATIVIGDPTRASSVSGFSLSPGGESETGESYYGILCNRGNAAESGEPPAVPNTVLRHLRVGPHFTHGVVVVNSTKPEASGCNLQLVSSYVEGGRVGVQAFGCDHPLGEGEVSVALELGDGTPDGGNSFAHHEVPENHAVGAEVMACVSRFSARHNAFVDSDRGIGIVQRLRDPRRLNQVELVGNRFERLTNSGVSLEGAGMRVALRNNTFWRISSRPKSVQYAAIGLIVQGFYTSELDQVAEMPELAPVRENSFVSNDMGVAFRWAAVRDDFEPPDFGTPADPGRNQFRCNSSNLVGGVDVTLHIISSRLTPIAFKFAGNVWDHAPPEVTFEPPPDGVDVAMSRPNSVDISDAMIAPGPCPEDTLP